MKPVFLVSLFLGSFAFSDEERCPKHGLSINLNPGDVLLLEPIVKDIHLPQPAFVHRILGKWIAAPEWKHANASYQMATRPRGCSQPFLLQINVMANNIPVKNRCNENFLTKVWTRQKPFEVTIGSKTYGSLLVRSPASGGSTQKTVVPTESLSIIMEKFLVRSTTTKKPSLESADDLQSSTTSTTAPPPVTTSRSISIVMHTTQPTPQQRQHSTVSTPTPSTATRTATKTVESSNDRDESRAFPLDTSTTTPTEANIDIGFIVLESLMTDPASFKLNETLTTPSVPRTQPSMGTTNAIMISTTTTPPMATTEPGSTIPQEASDPTSSTTPSVTTTETVSEDWVVNEESTSTPLSTNTTTVTISETSEPTQSTNKGADDEDNVTVAGSTVDAPTFPNHLIFGDYVDVGHGSSEEEVVSEKDQENSTTLTTATPAMESTVERTEATSSTTPSAITTETVSEDWDVNEESTSTPPPPTTTPPTVSEPAEPTLSTKKVPADNVSMKDLSLDVPQFPNNLIFGDYVYIGSENSKEGETSTQPSTSTTVASVSETADPASIKEEAQEILVGIEESTKPSIKELPEITYLTMPDEMPVEIEIPATTTTTTTPTTTTTTTLPPTSSRIRCKCFFWDVSEEDDDSWLAKLKSGCCGFVDTLKGV